MNALDLIKAAEGCRLASYWDGNGEVAKIGNTPCGTCTVGYGDTGPDVVPGLIISQADADNRLTLSSGIATADALYAVGPDCWRDIGEARQAALVDMAYQMGRMRLLGFHMMIRAIQDGAWGRASKEALASKWAKQVPKRAKRDAGILLTGEWPERAAP